MDYFEIRPDPRLRPFVKCFWGLRIEGAPPSTERILPDGCCELVIHCGDSFTQHDEAGAWLQPRTLFVGPTMRALTLSTGHTVDVFAIRFWPAGAALLLRPPLAELRDSVYGIDELGIKPESFDGFRELTSEQRIAATEQLLLRELGRVDVDRGVLHAQTTICNSAGAARMQAIAQAAGISLRTLERRFQQQVGLSPKELARLTRLQRAVASVGATKATLASIAVRAGYADQSHFTREFSAIAGVSPAQYLKERHGLNDLFFSDGGAQ